MPTIAETIDHHLAASGLAFFADGYDPLFGLLDYNQPAPDDMGLFEVSFSDTVQSLVDPDVLDFVAAALARLPLSPSSATPTPKVPLLVTAHAVTPAAWWKRKTVFGSLVGTKEAKISAPTQYVEVACALPAIERKWAKARREENCSRYAGKSKSCPSFLCTPEDWLLAEVGTFVNGLTFDRSHGVSSARMATVSRNGLTMPVVTAPVTGERIEMFANRSEIEELNALRRATAASWESGTRKPTSDKQEIRNRAATMFRTLASGDANTHIALREKILSMAIDEPFDDAKERVSRQLANGAELETERVTVEVDLSGLRPALSSLHRQVSRFAHLPPSMVEAFVEAGRAVYDPDGYYATMAKLWAPEKPGVPMFS